MGNCCSSEATEPLSSRTGRSLVGTMARERQQDFREVYDVVEQIGRGSISNIYQVRRIKTSLTASNGQPAPSERPASVENNGDNNYVDVQYDVVYALKEIDLSLVDAEYMEIMTNEIETLRKMDHPNIIRLFEVYRDPVNNRLSMVLDLCQGGNLDKRTPYTEKQAAHLTLQILEAAKYLHDRGIIHRDLKMENVMFEFADPTNFAVKVIDFGLAVKYHIGFRGGVAGTPYTIAPEIIRGSTDYNYKVDMWSIGVMVFQLLCGERPFWGAEIKDLYYSITHAQYNFNAPVWKDISKEAKDFIRHLLTIDPVFRWSSDKALRHPWLAQGVETVTQSTREDTLKNLDSYAGSSDFRKLALQIIAHQSDPKELLKLRKIFLDMDKGKDGYITPREFQQALQELGYEKQHIDRLFDELDVDMTRKIKYSEFLAATMETKGRLSEQRLADAFRVLDADGTGYISKENLREALGKNAEEAYIEKLIQEADFSGDGKISYEEFKQAMLGQIQDNINELGKSVGATSLEGQTKVNAATSE